MQELIQHEAGMRDLVALSAQIARRGYGEAVIEMALRRKGLPRETARLMAVSVVGSHAAITTAEAAAKLAPSRAATAGNGNDIDARAARAASLALSKLASFLLFIVASIGVGVLLGWSIGFSLGVEDGFDWMTRTIDRVVAGRY